MVPSSQRSSQACGWRLGEWAAGPAPPTEPFAFHEDSNYAVLFDRKAFRRFLTQLKANPQVTHLYLVTDSESSFNQMRAKLPDGLTTSMLYRDYLGNFRINTLEAYR